GDYVISVKYDSKSIVGTHSSGSSCDYTFVGALNGTTIFSTFGKITANLNCTVGTISAGSCPAPVTQSRVTSETPTQMSVNAHPNPFTNKVTFRISSPVSGEVTLAVYNVTGQRIGIVYQGKVDAGVAKDVEYNAPAASKGMLFYTLTQGDKSVRGKILRLE